MTGISRREGAKSYERARFRRERDNLPLFVRIVVFGLVLACRLDVLSRVDQVAVRNHGMMGGLFKLSRAVVFRGAALVLRGMLEKFRGFQVMINAFLRHDLRITSGTIC
jgi:hypothetical protein